MDGITFFNSGFEKKGEIWEIQLLVKKLNCLVSLFGSTVWFHCLVSLHAPFTPDIPPDQSDIQFLYKQVSRPLYRLIH